MLMVTCFLGASTAAVIGLGSKRPGKRNVAIFAIATWTFIITGALASDYLPTHSLVVSNVLLSLSALAWLIALYLAVLEHRTQKSASISVFLILTLCILVLFVLRRLL